MNRVLKGATMLALVVGLLCCVPCALADTVSAYIPVELFMTGDKQPDPLDFAIVLQSNNASNPMPANKVLIIRDQGTGRIGPIDYSEPNDYTYTLYQVSGTLPGYTYDPRVYNVTIQITSDARGKLTATVYLRDGSGNKPDRAIFENSFHDRTKIPKTGYGTAQAGAWALLLGWCALLVGAWRWQATR